MAVAIGTGLQLKGRMAIAKFIYVWVIPVIKCADSAAFAFKLNLRCATNESVACKWDIMARFVVWYTRAA